ncbi:hypothetical protein [Parasitella parasitica]|uniref:Uncharacterized protein n=1 Tax=Parasitella parasitica TaxID=35722 RepID=A0A0B7NIS4_9FUNG|nr:hypothetical protein [Parasitella parasitica]
MLKQLLSPRALTRSLRTALAIVTAGWLICILMHITAEPGQPGIIIDFIGNRNVYSHEFSNPNINISAFISIRTKNKHIQTLDAGLRALHAADCASANHIQPFFPAAVERHGGFDAAGPSRARNSSGRGQRHADVTAERRQQWG